MIVLRNPPDARRIGRFLDDQRSLPHSEQPRATERREATGPDQLRGPLGAGRETFARAGEALRRWTMYATGQPKFCWPDAPITAGNVVRVLGRHFGLWSLNAPRIVCVIEEQAQLPRRYGFAFGTLPGHAERHRAEDSVFYEVFALARPADPLVELGLPFVRLIQRRFAAASLRAMAAAHRRVSRLYSGVSHPFREALRFTVIAVTSVMSGTFPYTYRILYMMIDCWRVRGPSRHRHSECH